MKKLLSIIVLSLLFSGNAYAETVYLNCSFINGSFVDKEYNNEKTIDYKSDVTIDLDLKTNTVLDGPHLRKDSDPIMDDDYDIISWQSQIGPQKKGTFYWINLNRRNGDLNILTFSTVLKYNSSENYKCIKTEKKLF